MSNLTHLLLVEDEKNLGSTLSERLEQNSYGVSWFRTQHEALKSLEQNTYPLALLDVGIPDGSGFEIARILGKKSPSTAVIFLSARGDPEDRIQGLELGAEDYIVKPFHFKELLLRIQNGLRRARFLTHSSQENPEPLILGKAKIFFSRFEVELDQEIHPLTHKEASLLQLLFERRGQVVSRDEILNFAWSEDEFPTPRTVDNFIMRLRRLIEEQPENPKRIKSIRGIGYQLL